MSGTRKMEKFEVDAYVNERAPDPNADLPARPFEPRTPDPPAPPPPATGDTRALEQVLASAAAEARAARDSLGTAAAALHTPAPAPIATPIPDPPPTPRNHGGTPAEAWVPAEAAIPQQASVAPPPEPVKSTPDQLRTRQAQKFVTLADTMNEAFNGFAIGAGAWNIELTVPQGMSTGGGKQALQHLRLVPRRQGFHVFVAAIVNQVEHRAELRDFDHVAIMHEVRHSRPLEISSQEWEQFLRKAEVVLNGAGIQSMRTPPPRELLEQRRSAQRVSKSAVIALVVVLVLAAVVVWRVILALRAG